MSLQVHDPRLPGQFESIRFGCRKAPTLTAVNNGGNTTAIRGATAVRLAGTAALDTGAVSESLGTGDYFVEANMPSTLNATGLIFGVGPVTGAVGFSAGNYLAAYFCVSGLIYSYNPASVSQQLGRNEYIWPSFRVGILRSSGSLHYFIKNPAGLWEEVGAEPSTSAVEHQIHITIGALQHGVANVEIWIP